MGDINRLSASGLAVTINGQLRKYHAALLVFLADTLAAHQIGGLNSLHAVITSRA